MSERLYTSLEDEPVLPDEAERTVEVDDLPMGIEEEDILPVFENKRIKGGPVDRIRWLSATSALVTYSDREVAGRILRWTAEKPLRILGHTLAVQPCPVRSPVGGGCCVLVCGLNADLGDEDLFTLLENPRKGGGPVDNINRINDESALVVFENDSHALNWVELGEASFAGIKLKISWPTNALNIPEPEPTDPLTIYIENVSPEESETLELVLESKRIGGGPMENYKRLEDGTVVVRFAEELVAQSFIQKGVIEMGSKKFSVSETRPKPKKVEMATPKTPKDESVAKTIEISGIPKEITEDYLRMYFESEKRSGGGEIVHMQYSNIEGVATITFKDPHVVMRILSKEEHKLGSAELEVIVLESLMEDLRDQECAVRVSGITGLSKDFVDMHFESERRSGGGPLEETLYGNTGDFVIITFGSPEVAKRVAQKQHVLEGKMLTVERLKAAPPPPMLVGEIDNEKLLFRGLSLDKDKNNERTLTKYIGAVAASEVRHVTYAVQPDVAVVNFSSVPDYKALRKLVVSKSFAGQMISVQKVSPTSTIIVRGIRDVSEDMITLHFENVGRSGGGDVKSTTLSAKKDSALVEFKDRSVIANVLSRSQAISGREVKVGLYYPYLENGGSTGKRRIPVNIPNDVVMEIDDNKAKFFAKFGKLRDEIQSELGGKFCSVTWPTSDEPRKIVLHCTLTPEDENAAALVVDWATTCQTSFESRLAAIVSGEERVSSEVWKPFIGEFKKSAAAEMEMMCTEQDESNCSLHFTGATDAVSRFQTKASSLLHKLMEELAKAKRKKFETVTGLPAAHVQIIKRSGFWKSVSTDLEVSFDGKGISFQGTEKEIMMAKLKMYEDVINKLHTKTFQCDALKLRLLRKADNTQHFQNQFEKQGLNIAWIVGDVDISITGFSVSEIDGVFSAIDGSLLEKKIPLDASNQPAIALPQWSELERNLVKRFPCLEVSVAKDKSSVICCGLSDAVDPAVADIEMFLQQNTTLEEFLTMLEGKVRYISKHFRKEMVEITKSLSTDGVTLEGIEDGPKSGFVVRGSRRGITEAKERLVRLSKDILEAVHNSDIPGVQRFFMARRGHDALLAIENRSKVAIVLSKEEQKSGGDGKGRSAGSGSGSADQPLVVKSEVVVDETIIKVLKSGISNCRADALVISIGEQLKYIDGPAKLVCDAGGKEIEDEASDYCKKNKPISGQAFSTGAGQLRNFMTVIHAVLKPWQDAAGMAENILYEAVFQSLKLAANTGLSSVAIVGIGCGFLPSVSAAVVVEVIGDFQKDTNRKFKEIILFDSSDQMVNHFHENLIKKFGKDKVVIIDANSGAASAAANRPQTLVTTPSRFVKTSNALSLSTPEGITVTVVKGAIADQKVDVIVNTVSEDLNLSHGAVSNSLLQAAGAGLQTECKSKLPAGGKLPHGQIVATANYSLTCKQVYHGSCDKWDQGAGKCEQTMRDLLKACLQSAHTNKMTSIAIPAIGTGNLLIPRKVACQVMFEEADIFSKSNLGTPLKDIRFVVYDQDNPTIAAFSQHVQDLTSGAVAGAAGTPAKKGRLLKQGGTIRSPSSPAVGAAEFKKVSKKTKKAAARAASGAVSLQNKYIKIGELRMEVAQGDITEEDTDAIVNSTNDNLTLQGGAVTQAIVRKGGKTIEEECKRIGKTKDSIAVTGSGNLPCKCIIHLAAPSAFDKKAPSSKDWEDRVKKVLKAAEDLKLKSVALPLLGTGKWTTPAADMAESILNAVGDFSINSRPYFLKLVRITIFQDQMVNDFGAAVAKKIDERNNRGVVGRFKDWWGGAGDIKLIDCDDNDDDDDDNGGGAMVDFYTKISFSIYGLLQRDIDEVMKEIDDLGKDAIVDKVLDSPDIQAQIAKLTQDQISRIKRTANQQSVHLDVEQGKKLNRIRLQGDGRDVTTVLQDVLNILHEADIAQHKKNEADLIAQQAHWEFQLSDNTFEAYPSDINVIIEKAFQAKLPFAEWEEADDTWYMIDFAQSVEIKKSSGPVTPVAVKRISDVPIPEPKGWDPMPSGVICLLVNIPIGTDEYDEVVKNIKIAPRNTIKEIIKIERMQNPSLYQQYAVRKLHMEAANGPKVQNERILWHGTSAETLQQINNHGFNRSYCGKNAVVYGKGVYFASEWWYSANDTYSPPDSTGRKYIYQARVLTGEFVVGKEDFIDVPLKQNNKVLRYDSVVNDLAKPIIFVIFRDAQAYPEYLVTFI